MTRAEAIAILERAVELVDTVVELNGVCYCIGICVNKHEWWSGEVYKGANIAIANAKLIASAPDMLAELTSLREENARLREAERWIPVSEAPLFLPDEGDTWEVTEAGCRPFIAYIPIEHNGKPEDWIAWCYIEEGTFNLCYVGSEDDTGWSPADVTHYIPKTLPPKPEMK